MRAAVVTLVLLSASLAASSHVRAQDDGAGDGNLLALATSDLWSQADDVCAGMLALSEGVSLGDQRVSLRESDVDTAFKAPDGTTQDARLVLETTSKGINNLWLACSTGGSLTGNTDEIVKQVERARDAVAQAQAIIAFVDNVCRKAGLDGSSTGTAQSPLTDALWPNADDKKRLGAPGVRDKAVALCSGGVVTNDPLTNVTGVTDSAGFKLLTQAWHRKLAAAVEVASVVLVHTPPGPTASTPPPQLSEVIDKASAQRLLIQQVAAAGGESGATRSLFAGAAAGALIGLDGLFESAAQVVGEWILGRVQREAERYLAEELYEQICDEDVRTWFPATCVFVRSENQISSLLGTVARQAFRRDLMNFPFALRKHLTTEAKKAVEAKTKEEAAKAKEAEAWWNGLGANHERIGECRRSGQQSQDEDCRHAYAASAAARRASSAYRTASDGIAPLLRSLALAEAIRYGTSLQDTAYRYHAAVPHLPEDKTSVLFLGALSRAGATLMQTSIAKSFFATLLSTTLDEAKAELVRRLYAEVEDLKASVAMLRDADGDEEARLRVLSGVAARLVSVHNLCLELADKETEKVPAAVVDIIDNMGSGNAPALLTTTTALMRSWDLKPETAIGGDHENILKWLAFSANLVSAANEEEAQSALETLAAPIGSWRAKRQRTPTITVSALTGIMASADVLVRGQHQWEFFGGFGFHLSIGADLNDTIESGSSWFGTYGVYAPLLDLTPLASIPFARSDANHAFDVRQTFAPGFFFRLGLRDAPVVFAAGVQYQAYGRPYDDSSGADTSSFRVSLLAAVETTIFGMY